MKILYINTFSRRYPIFIGKNIFGSLKDFMISNNLPNQVFVIFDKNLEKIYGPFIRKTINSLAARKYFFSVPASEKIKSFNTINKIFTCLYEKEFSRDTLLIAVGGGTIGDVAGFAASTYMRGIPLLHVPTTLLSAVDSSIGGKTAINFKEAKNLVGSFYQPSLVLIDTDFLKSLSEEQLISGFGEVIKYSYLTDGNFYSMLLSNYESLMTKDLKFLNNVIYESVKIKSSVISKDEFEKSGLRKILNLGHTFAHAFESNTGYKFPHGKAVIAGIISALFLSSGKGLLSSEKLEYMLRLPLSFRSSLQLKKIDAREAFRVMSYDKKKTQDKINFVLLKDFGEILVDVRAETKSVYSAIQKTNKVLFKRATAGL